MANGKHISRHAGRGWTPLALRKGNAAQPPLPRRDAAAPAVKPNEPVQGGWQSPVKEDRR
jgi:hypothetical protein